MASTALSRACGRCFREHASAIACATRSISSRRNWQRSRPRCARRYARSFTPCSTGRDSAKACGCLRWANGSATLPTMSPTRLGRRTASACDAGFRTRRWAGMQGSQPRRCPSPVPGWIRKPTCVSHRDGALVQPRAVSASRPACRAVWSGSGRRSSTYIRLDTQPANPHLGWLSMSRRNAPPPHAVADIEQVQNVKKSFTFR
jgi:hypothetical protein